MDSRAVFRNLSNIKDGELLPLWCFVVNFEQILHTGLAGTVHVRYKTLD